VKVKRTLWISVVGGLVLGALSFISTLANLTIQISGDLILGPWEIFNVISAALFGPIGLLITELGLDVSGYLYLVKGVYPAPQDSYFMIGNYLAHIGAMLFVAFGYRYLYQRWKMPRLLAGWLLVMGIYYVVGIILSVLLHNLAVPGLGATLAAYFRNVRLEFAIVTIITALILLALPKRYRRPQWYEPSQTLAAKNEAPAGEIRNAA
jgi:hypothetical protein